MLVIFPFEAALLPQPATSTPTFVGHPLAELPQPQQRRAKSTPPQHSLDPIQGPGSPSCPAVAGKRSAANLPTLHELAMSDLINAASATTTFNGQDLEVPRDPAAHTHYEFLLPIASTVRKRDLEVLHLKNSDLQTTSATGAPEARSLRTITPRPRRPRSPPPCPRQLSSQAAPPPYKQPSSVIPFIVVYRVSPLTFALARKAPRRLSP